MECRDTVRRLIVNADDFGRSSSINSAVLRAHVDGILTTASLMVAEDGFSEAVEIARQNPKLGVGLHLALSHGSSVLPPQEIPGLVDSSSRFSNRAEATGFRYFAKRDLRPQLRAEIRAQLEKFRSTGLELDHVNGHLHFHLHPVVFSILMELASEFNIRRMRLTRDPFFLNAGIDRGRWLYKSSHAVIYKCLSARAAGELRRWNIRHTRHVFGLMQNALVDERYVLKLLARLPEGDSELYSHPSLDDFKHELDALVSGKVKAAIHAGGIRLIRYEDL
jgi:hopanoid biosynthesis associated protein HpnK